NFARAGVGAARTGGSRPCKYPGVRGITRYDPKARLPRQRLQSALSRVVMTVVEMDEAGVGPNPDNLASIGLAQEMLTIALKLPRPVRRRPPDAMAALKRTLARRQRETEARRRRQRRADAAT